MRSNVAFSVAAFVLTLGILRSVAYTYDSVDTGAMIHRNREAKTQLLREWKESMARRLEDRLGSMVKEAFDICDELDVPVLEGWESAWCLFYAQPIPQLRDRYDNAARFNFLFDVATLEQMSNSDKETEAANPFVQSKSLDRCKIDYIGTDSGNGGVMITGISGRSEYRGEWGFTFAFPSPIYATINQSSYHRNEWFAGNRSDSFRKFESAYSSNGDLSKEAVILNGTPTTFYSNGRKCVFRWNTSYEGESSQVRLSLGELELTAYLGASSAVSGPAQLYIGGESIVLEPGRQLSLRCQGNMGVIKLTDFEMDMELVRKALKANDPRIRQFAIERLGSTKDAGVVQELVSTLVNDKDAQVQRSALYALNSADKSAAFTRLTTIVEKGNSLQRCNALWALTKLNHTGIGETLLIALDDDDAIVRLTAAICIAEISDAGFIGPLCQRLKDNNPCVRSAAAAILARIADSQAVEVLIAALEDEEAFVRFNAITALQVLGDPRAVEPIIKVLSDESGLVQLRAAMALGTWSGDRTIEELAKLLSDGDGVGRYGAAFTFGQIGNARAIDLLSDSILDPDEFLRYCSALALNGLSNNRRVQEVLAAVMNNEVERSEIRRIAADAVHREETRRRIDAQRSSRRKERDEFMESFFGRRDP